VEACTVFIYWGSRIKTVTVGQGAFYCPQCHAAACYTHQHVKEYFTLYSIPLFSIALLGQFIECTRCHNKFQPSVRDLSPEQIEEMQKPWQCRCCQCLNPPSEMRCLNCKELRLAKKVAGQGEMTRAGQDNGAFREATRNSGARSTGAKAQSGVQDLAAIIASNKCPECGVVNSLVALHCKGCGRRLGADREK
jgi:hypothetical protein